ncbi:unnamed protein product [Linum trigynum]|uniref:Uncharacterized protein n=1 Tax=Linum trigynum TaxID=586398 RepID=A0AAV2FZH5_9ROSI
MSSSFPFLSYSLAAEIVESVEKSLAPHPCRRLPLLSPLRVHHPNLNRAPQPVPRRRCRHHQEALGRGQIWVAGGRELNLERERPFVAGALEGFIEIGKGCRSSSSTELEKDSPTTMMGWVAMISPSFPRAGIR